MNKKIISIIGIGTALFLGFAASPAEKTNNKEYETVEQELNVSNTSTQNIENKDTESNNQNNEEIMDYQSVDNKNENSFSNESNNNKKTDEILTSQNEEETTDNVITGSISPFTESESNNHDIEKKLPLKALCNDGTVSYQDDVSKNNYRGMCSHHGGIKEKLGRQK